MQRRAKSPSTPKFTLIYKEILGLYSLLNHFSLLNFVKPIKICLIKRSIVKIYSSKNQARLPIHFSFQARIKQDFFLNLHTKQDSSKTTVARGGSIKIETRVLTPKSSRSRFSSKSCSSLLLSKH